jgi:hypothetical protein
MGFLFSKPQQDSAPSSDDPSNQKALLKQKMISNGSQNDKQQAAYASCDKQINAYVEDMYNLGTRVPLPDGSCPPPGKTVDQGICYPWTTDDEKNKFNQSVAKLQSNNNLIKCVLFHPTTSNYAPEPWEEKSVMSGSVRYKNLDN